LPLDIDESFFAFKQIVCETPLTKLKLDLKELMEKVEGILTSCVRLAEEEIAGKVSWLNRPYVVLTFFIKISSDDLIIQVGYEKLEENKLSINEMEELCQLFMEFLSKLIDEYDTFLIF